MDLLGTDLNMIFDGTGTGDIDPTGATVSGVEAVAQALACRLVTPQGGLFYDLSYGYDLRRLREKRLSQSLLASIGPAVEAQCRLDERVQTVAVKVTPPAQPSAPLVVDVEFESIYGQGRLVLKISDVTVEILRTAIVGNT